MKWYECLTVLVLVLGVLYFFYKIISLSGKDVEVSRSYQNTDNDWTSYRETTIFDPVDESVRRDIEETKKEIQKVKDEIKNFKDSLKRNKV
jgi:hypothetical protein